MNTALLVIDVQHALCNGTYAAYDIERVIGRINAVIAKARAAGAPVIFIQHEAQDGPLRFGQDAWQLDPRLDLESSDLRIRKTASDSFHETGLQPMLRARGIETLVVCGLQSEFCVDSSVRGALAQGFDVQLVRDAHSTLDNGVLTAAQIVAHHNVTLANVDSYRGRVTLVAAKDAAFSPSASPS
jgi:nicotinamidase-related amidase